MQTPSQFKKEKMTIQQTRTHVQQQRRAGRAAIRPAAVPNGLQQQAAAYGNIARKALEDCKKGSARTRPPAPPQPVWHCNHGSSMTMSQPEIIVSIETECLTAVPNNPDGVAAP